jgi:hypothetical protein
MAPVMHDTIPVFPENRQFPANFARPKIVADKRAIGLARDRLALGSIGLTRMRRYPKSAIQTKILAGDR